jgi:WD40 repeat protein
MLAAANRVREIDNGRAQEATEYEEWIRPYRIGPLHMGPGFIRSASADDGSRAILVITAVEGDDLKPDEPNLKVPGDGDRITRYGCSVSTEGRVSFFQYSAYGAKGGGYPAIPSEDLHRLKQLLQNLPDDHAQLPPAGRRVVLQVPDGDQVLARAYDRANMPDQVLEILRLSESRIKSWALNFDVQRKWNADQFSMIGAFTLTPDGKYFVSATMNGPFRVWDSESYDIVREAPVPLMPLKPGWRTTAGPVEDIEFSPDGSLAAVGGFAGDVDLYNARTWEGIRKLSEVVEGQHRLSCPRFTPDGRFLLVQSREPALRIFDTKTWEPHVPLAEMPSSAVTYFPAQREGSAIYTSAKGTIMLWNQKTRRNVAQLDDNGRILTVCFAPDQSLVAITTAHADSKTKVASIYRIRIWRTDSGKLVHELRPFEQPAFAVGGLAWWPNGKYLLASVRADSFFTNVGIGVWDVTTGRFRGEFSGCPNAVYGFALLHDGKRLVEGCSDGNILLWDAASAIEQIESLRVTGTLTE